MKDFYGAVECIGKTQELTNLPKVKDGFYASISVGPFENDKAAKFYLENTMKKRIP